MNSPTSAEIPFPSTSTLPTHRREPSSQVLIAGTALFQQTFANILTTVQNLQQHIRASSTSSLLLESESFEALIASLISQVGEVSDDLVDSKEEEGDYETLRANLRYTLKDFLGVVRKRSMDEASQCLSFVLDVLWTFMEASIDVVKSWQVRNTSFSSTPHIHPSLAPIVTFITRPVNKDLLSPTSAAFMSSTTDVCLSPASYQSTPKPLGRRKSILKRLRSMSNLGRKSYEERRGSAMTPLMAEQMRARLRDSMDHCARPLLHNENFHADKENKPPAPTENRLRNALQRCKSVVNLKLPDSTCSAPQSKDLNSPERLRRRSTFRRRESEEEAPPVPPLPPLVVIPACR